MRELVPIAPIHEPSCSLRTIKRLLGEDGLKHEFIDILAIVSENTSKTVANRRGHDGIPTCHGELLTGPATQTMGRASQIRRAKRGEEHD